MSLLKFSGVSLLTLCCAAPTMAAPYQFEVGGMFLTGEASAGNQEADIENLGIEGTYYLKPVDEDSGPLSLRAFLDTAASVTVGFSQSEFGTNDTDSLTAEARLISATNLIGIIEVDQDDGGGDKTLNYVLGVGTYLDPKTEALFTVGIDDDAGDTMTYTATYHKLLDGGSPGTYIDFTASVSYIDNDFDSGNGFSIGGTYYPSELLGISASFDTEEVGNFETENLSVAAEYFLSETLAVGVGYVTGEIGQIDTDGIAFRASARF